MSRLLLAPLSARAALPSPTQTSLLRLLLHDGVHVESAATVEEARASLAEPDVAILVHDEDVPREPAERTVRALRTWMQAGRSSGIVLLLSSAPEHAAAAEARALSADDVLPIALGPQILALRVRAYLSLSGRAQGREKSTPPREVQVPSYRHDLLQRLVHDLRNPLAGLSSNLSYVDDRVACLNDAELSEALLDCRAAAGRLRRAATMLVDIGPLEDSSLLPRQSRTALLPLLKDVVSSRQHEAALRQLQLVVDVPEGLFAPVDPELVPRLLHALLDHALRYVKAGTTLLISGTLSDRLTLFMSGQGDWLPKSTSKSDGADAKEAGLCIYYAHLVLKAHGSALRVVSEQRGQPAAMYTTAKLSL